MYKLTLQIYVENHWWDAAELSIFNPQVGLKAGCKLGYKPDYLVEHLEKLSTRLAWSLSANHPLSWDTYSGSEVLALLQDITPAGAARRFLEARYGELRPNNLAMDVFLLATATPAPIGHLRIKEASELLKSAKELGFSRNEVVQRDQQFLEYAYEQGAAIGGATGAGGEAPKLLLTETSQGLLYPDAVLADNLAMKHWFIKFPRNRAGTVDQDILRSEYCYYQAIDKLGFLTVDQADLRLEEGSKPSLWMQRFDRKHTNHQVDRFALESIYSLLKVTIPGSYLKHLDVLKCLLKLWQKEGQVEDIPALVLDYLSRDLLNLVVGNSDNHGRNLSIIRTEQTLKLAPIYDLAPMVMDEEGVTRTTKWPQSAELGGEVNWLKVCQMTAEIANLSAEWLYDELCKLASKLLALPDLLLDLGLPEQTWQHPRIPLSYLPKYLSNRGLVR
ncbi:HipA domain-containing protein [Marinospirillum insulare]|uniref:Toxin HipA n=1 Tax=Marinospirillum insulare TaxID=217169 RepID=A0ABQ5ZY84_9GAMM|nr:HipA domain-containing protein [Marinospirillum insulare]GLR64253.1 toxin HipA [Marinospirillum insulare]